MTAKTGQRRMVEAPAGGIIVVLPFLLVAAAVLVLLKPDTPTLAIA